MSQYKAAGARPSSTAEQPSDMVEKSRRKIIIACTVGGALEWYDFGVYGLFAIYIGRAFFSSTDETLSLLMTFAAYAIGFVVRPLGAIVLGMYADRYGRKNALSLSMFLMALGIAIILLTPSYASIGIAAPLLILLARMIQGVSTGGEIGGALSYLIESAPAARRGYYASFQQLSQTGSFLIAAIVAWIVTSVLNEAQLQSWGWRIPFAVGLLIAPVGWYVRRQLDESPMFQEQASRPKEHVSVFLLARRHWRQLLLGSGLVVLWTVCSKIPSSFMPAYAVRDLGMPPSSPYLGLLAVGVALLAAPYVGFLSDRFGRKKLMIIASLLMIVTAYPAFWVLEHYRYTWVLVGQQFFLAVLLVIYSGPASAMLSEIYETDIRSTGIGVSYNFSVTIFGGFAPAIGTLLVWATNDPKSIAYYLIFAAIVSLFALSRISDKTGQYLE